MAINVTCPGCLTRFSVGDKFAGKQGPCPKCKAVITIPKPSDEVIIHAPEHSEAGAIGVGGRHALKTYKRQETMFKPLVFTAVVGCVLVALLMAIVLRTMDTRPQTWLLALAAIILGPLSAGAGYPFMRDAELEPYRGMSFLVRATACGLAFALSWGVYMYVGSFWGLPERLEIYHLAILSGISLGIGTFASFVSFDLEPISAFFLCAMYFVVTVLLRLVAGLPALPGLVTG